ncbi:MULTISPECIES: hypothetical protein [unclassified Rhizobium]|uniref:hypothetical protein n=1 Tax=unclassified Rhizobium TaxID=2613769 RepID=UPI0006FF4D23|nr:MULTISPECIES: hypothetical protein [unclassified Rhizobium]KQV36455.1 hypothetical protein ASC86_24780 [Rhizobium sp. Root1212]KRD26745.1 hypothetical protein ASE37_24695 [Rhizobium sp. Root268]
MQLLKLTVYANGAVLLLSPSQQGSDAKQDVDPLALPSKTKMVVQWSREKSIQRPRGPNRPRPFTRSFYDDEIVASPVLR